MNQEERTVKYPASAIGTLKSLLHGPALQQGEGRSILTARDEVLGRYQNLFQTERIATLTAEEFQDFLIFKNNKHWNGLHRQGPKICGDMPLLRKALGVLLNEEIPLAKRLDKLIPQNGKTMVPGLGKAILTAVLLIRFPDKYGVWNGTSQAAMESLGLWPQFERGVSFGSRYMAVNEVLNRTAKELGTDLWTLDVLWWAAIVPPEKLEKDSVIASEGSGVTRFNLERHLHDYLADHWDRTDLAREWSIYEEDGEQIGYEYVCEVGKIDLLARHKKTPERWLVIELKKDSAGDQTVGQVCRYLGWVKRHLAGEKGSVQGLIIAAAKDKKLSYALSSVPNVSLLKYEMIFRLVPMTFQEAD